MSTDRPASVGPQIAGAWELDGDDAARLERLLQRVADLLGDELTGPGLAALQQARALVASAEGDPVPDWIAEAESAGVTAERRALLLDALALWSEHNGVHGAIAQWAQRAARAGTGAVPAEEVVRTGALRALARAKPDALVGEWIKGLGSDDVDTRLGAIHLLAESRSPMAVRPLASLVVEGDVRTLEATVWALGELGIADPVAEAVLVDALQARLCPGEVTAALGKMGGPATLRVLLREAARGEPVVALLAAARVVERHLPFDVADAELSPDLTRLRKLLVSNGEPSVHALCAVILARLGQPLSEDDIERALGLA